MEPIANAAVQPAHSAPLLDVSSMPDDRTLAAAAAAEAQAQYLAQCHYWAAAQQQAMLAHYHAAAYMPKQKVGIRGGKNRINSEDSSTRKSFKASNIGEISGESILDLSAEAADGLKKSLV